MVNVGNVGNRFWMITAIFALALMFVSPVESANILAIETFAGKSHWNFMSAVLRALTDNGHSVTVYTPFLDGNRENYTEVDISDGFEMSIEKSLTKLSMFRYSFTRLHYLVQMNRGTCKTLYSNRQWRLSENRTTEFDVIIVEPNLLDCITHVANIMDLPLIYCKPTSGPLYLEERTFGDIANPATVSQIWVDRAVPRTFFDRFTNTVFMLYTRYVVTYKMALFKMFEWRPYDAYTAVPPSLMLVNGHFVSDPSRSMSQNIINIGGIHLKPAQKLPKDILEFIEDSPHGVILLTFGSIVSISTLPNQIKIAFLEAFAQLPQRVLLKYEDELEDKPNNVMIRKWFPQRDILLHPKVKLFISHGGISGMYEAVDAGVPVLGFPLIVDQPKNIDNLVEAGMAISMDIFSVSKDTFLKNVMELINDGKYKKNAIIASKIFKDRPMSPQQLVVYWTEYVVRHKGAPHLKSQALNLAWYQYLLLDVMAVPLILFSILLIYQYSFLLSRYIKTKPE